MTTDFNLLNQHFDAFSDQIQHQLQLILESGNPIVRIQPRVADLSDLYVDSIPAEFNPIFRERRYFDGQYDRNFIRRIGTIAMITPDYKVVSLWDFETATLFESTRKTLADAIHQGVIQDAFLESERVAGHLPNVDSQEPSITWTHYYVELPNHVVDTYSKDEVLGRHRDAVQVFRRTMTEVNLSDLETVLDLINENQLYRGEEFKGAIENWMTFKSKFNANTTDAYIWYHALESGRGIGFRNTVIGTLLTDLYNGEELEKAVRAYESRVAPSNYKRPTSLVTPKMVENAKQTLAELGFLESVYRRAARLTDIPSTQFLFTTQATRALSVFDELTQDANASTKNVTADKATTITLAEFLERLPHCSQVELLPTAALKGNQVVLTDAVDKSAPTPFAWNNTLSWAYANSDTADAITQRVKDAGGEIDAHLRVSLSWNNADDLDLAVYSHKCRRKVWFRQRRDFGAHLDVDANAVPFKLTDEPVENIYWKNASHLVDGTYDVIVNRYNHRRTQNVGFDVQVATRSGVRQFHMDTNNVEDKRILSIVVRGGQITIENVASDVKELAVAANANTFIPVKHVLLSPNMWETPIGNRHVFLLTDDVMVDEPVRGFFNEQLNSKLTPHRKVTEILGTKLKIDPADFNVDGIAKGYGFSATMDATFIVRLTDSFGRRELVHVSVKQ